MEFTAEEIAIFDDIERRREKIIAEAKALVYRDYGAGNPDIKRSAEEMYAGVVVESTTANNCRIGLKGEWARWMYAQLKRYRPRNVLELGTNCGFSAIYMAKGSPESKIHTLEGAEAVAGVAKENLYALACSNVIQHIGRFQDILETVLSSMVKVDFAFIDGHHDGEATLGYFEQIKPYLSSGAVVVFDDIHWSEGMESGWELIKNDSQILSFEDLGKLGVIYCR